MFLYVMVAWEEKCHNPKYSPWNLPLSWAFTTEHNIIWAGKSSWHCQCVAHLWACLGWGEGEEAGSLVAVWAQCSSSGSTDVLSTSQKAQPLWAAEKAACATPTPEHPHCAGACQPQWERVTCAPQPLSEKGKNCCAGVTENVRCWAVRDGQEDEQ